MKRPLALFALLLAACPKPSSPVPGGALTVGLVTDVGGRGDQSFNDSALRGLELWAAAVKSVGAGYAPASADEVKASVPADISAATQVHAAGVTPLVVQSKHQEDYEPNLQILVDQGAGLVIGTGFMLENAVEAVAKRNPGSRFLLIDSPIMDVQGKPYTLPNVKTVVFREEEGSFLIGALTGLVTQSNKVGFVGGMEIPLIKKFEAGYRAGVAQTNPKAEVLVNYTGSFDNVATGKQVAQDLVLKGADVVFHAAGSCGLGAIQAVREARDAGKKVFAIGVDSDQFHLAPNAVLTSMVKHVDLAVYQTVVDLSHGSFHAGDSALGLKEGGVGYAEVRLDFPGKADALKRVEAIRQKIIAGEIHVPANTTALAAFRAAP
jgi:basic membrane protein A and related proteins